MRRAGMGWSNRCRIVAWMLAVGPLAVLPDVRFFDLEPSHPIFINFNTDVSNFWEFSGQGSSIVSDENEAYKLGVNYVVYALTH